MPNGKGSKEWGWKPSFEELFVAFVISLLCFIASNNLFFSLVLGVVGGGLLLWSNNGWHGPWDD